MKEHKLAAIVFTDIVGYTKRMEADEERTMQLLSRQREIVFPMVKDFGGEVIKEIGDGLLMMFTSAIEAVRFVMAVQEKLEGEELTIRAGIHIGDVIFEGGDVFGSAVNIAARIEPLALPGGICISEDVRNQVRNKEDIATVSIGRKELKGVNDPVEIYRVIRSGSDREKVSILSHLWERRVFQITAIYLALAYLIRLAVAYIVREYMLSPYLVDLVWYLTLALVPSILLIAYFHGRKGVAGWSRVELIGLPANAVLAGLLIIFLFRGKDLGAATTTVSLQDETGATIEKTIFKSEFRKNILLFNIENKTGDKDLDYLQYAIPIMATFDLSQDLLISPQTMVDAIPEMEEAGYKNGIGLPLTLMKQYAEKRHMNHFLAGELKLQDRGYVLAVRLYETKLTKQIAEFSVSAENLFDMADQLSVEIKKAVGLPQSHIDETADLPVSEIFTSSETAMSHFALAVKADAMKNWEEKVDLLERAIKEDPGFAAAHFIVALAYFDNNDMAGAKQTMQQIMDRYLHRLPEKTQFSVKYLYYILNQEPEKAFIVVKMWAELFPSDPTAHESLAVLSANRNLLGEAIAEYREILRLDPERSDVYKSLGDLYMRDGKHDSALICYQQYAGMLPQEADAYITLGNYYVNVGEFEPALKSYERALVVADATDKESVMVSLGNVHRISGNFDEAYEQYMNVLRNAGNATDSATAYAALEKLFLVKGQMKKSLEAFELRVQKVTAMLTPFELAIFRAFNIEPYIHAGELDRAFEILEGFDGMLEPPVDKVVSFGYMPLYLETGDTARAMEAISSAEKLARDFGEENLMSRMYDARAKIDERNGKYREAIENYSRILEIAATDYGVRADMARCYRLMKEYKEAEREIQIALKYRPFDPVNNYEAALLYLDMGDRKEAKEYLQKTVDIWKDADPDYDKSGEARALLATL